MLVSDVRFIGTMSRAGAFLSGDKVDIATNSVEASSHEVPGTHVLWFFLNPDPLFDMLVLCGEGYVLLFWRGVELLETNDGNVVVTAFFFLFRRS